MDSFFYHFQSKWLNFHFLKEGTRPEVRGRRLNFCTNFSDFHQKLHSAFHQCQCRDYWKVFLWLLFPFSEARNIYLFKRKTCPTTSVSPSLQSSWGGSNCFSGKPGKRCIYLFCHLTTKEISVSHFLHKSTYTENINFE